MRHGHDKDWLAHRCWEQVRAFRGTEATLDGAQESFGELCSRFLGALLTREPEWPASKYWFDGIALESARLLEPDAVELVGSVHFARGQDDWFTGPVRLILSAPPDAPLDYRVTFDGAAAGEGRFDLGDASQT